MLHIVLPNVLSLLSRMYSKGTLAKVFWSVASFPYTQRYTFERVQADADHRLQSRSGSHDEATWICPQITG
jgi:hypothetical protein